MFENRFTERAENALRMATASAMAMGHDYVGSEHILLGLIKEGGGIAGRILTKHGIDEDKVKNKLAMYSEVGESSAFAPSEMTPRSKRVMEIAFAEARRFGSGYIGTEHILMALLRESDSLACKVLNQLGADAPTLYNEIVSLISSGEQMSPQAGGMFGKKGDHAGKDTPILNQFGRDLVEKAKEGKIDPVIGRDGEIDRVIQTLIRRNKNNPCLIGEPGVGKTAIAEGLALKILNGEVPELLKNKRIVTLDLSSMVAGAKYRGEFEDRLKNALEELRNSGNIILFIDEIHTIVGAGAAEGAIDAANILKPSLARGEIQVIGATTINEYRKHIEKDAALERRFQPVLVEEPTAKEAVAILHGVKDKYEAHHNVKITDEAILAAVELSRRYISDRFLPDKAIDLIDEAASKIRLKEYTAPPDLKELEDKIEKMSGEKENAVRSQEFEKAAKLRDTEKQLKSQLDRQRQGWVELKKRAVLTVTKEDIANVLSSISGIPVQTLTEDESARLLKMEEILHKRVIGQEEAVTAISKAIRRSRVGLKDPKRPVGSFIFLGPTGVGKTELSRALAEAMFGDENAMIRVDMSEFMEKHAVSKLVGSPPGYIGYDEGGQLTEKIRKRPYSVILFDEIEKAHPDVFNILLQMLEDGHITDSQGRKVDMKNCIIIMTSNVGAHKIMEKKKLGFDAGEEKKDESREYTTLKNDVLTELKRTFRPEFLNRVDEMIVFHQLTKEDIEKIAHVMLGSVTERVRSMGITLSFDPSAVSYLAKEGYDPAYGARPLRRTILSKVEDALSEKVLKNELKKGDSVTVKEEDGELKFS